MAVTLTLYTGSKKQPLVEMQKVIYLLYIVQYGWTYQENSIIRNKVQVFTFNGFIGDKMIVHHLLYQRIRIGTSSISLLHYSFKRRCWLSKIML